MRRSRALRGSSSSSEPSIPPRCTFFRDPEGRNAMKKHFVPKALCAAVVLCVAGLHSATSQAGPSNADVDSVFGRYIAMELRGVVALSPSSGSSTFLGADGHFLIEGESVAVVLGGRSLSERSVDVTSRRSTRRSAGLQAAAGSTVRSTSTASRLRSATLAASMRKEGSSSRARSRCGSRRRCASTLDMPE